MLVKLLPDGLLVELAGVNRQFLTCSQQVLVQGLIRVIHQPTNSVFINIAKKWVPFAVCAIIRICPPISEKQIRSTRYNIKGTGTVLHP